MSEEQRTPTLDTIDDPHGIPAMLFDETIEPGEAGARFVEEVQVIRWELWNLLGSLDNVEVPSSPAQWSVLQAIDHLGIAVRAEAAHLDGVQPDPADLFTSGSLRRFRRDENAEVKARARRNQMGVVEQPDTPDD